MATGMFGANTDELRALAGDFGDGSATTTEAKVTTATEVDGVIWMGIDAERFKMHYATAVAPMIKNLSIKLAQLDADLVRQADEQDECSDGRGGSNSSNQNGQNGQKQTGQNDQNQKQPSWDDYKDSWLYKLYKGHKDLVKLIKMPRTFIEFAEMLKGGHGLWGGGWKAMRAFEEALTESSRLHKWSRRLGDLLQLNPPKGWPLPNLSQKWSSFLTDKFGISQGLQEGLFGKTSRAFGKTLGLLGVAFDGYDAFNKFRTGDNAGGLYSTLKGALGIGSMVPGPVGIGCATASTGLFLYDNREWIAEKAGQLWEGTKQVAGDVWEGTKQVASDAWEGTKQVAGDVWEGTKQVASDTWEGTKHVANDVAEGAKQVAGDLAEGAKDVAGDIAEGAQNIADEVSSWVPPLPKIGW